jgi:hypothetical protein
MTDIGPVSAFVRSMPGLQLKAAVFPGGFFFLVFACAPTRPAGGHDHFQVEPGFDRDRLVAGRAW